MLQYVIEARLFGGAPGPMHAVSLGIHLADVALLIALARTTLAGDGKAGILLGLLAGLLYGLHPMLVAPVTWISSHDPLLVGVMLAALLASVRVRRLLPRAVLVSLLFFCGVLIKESAALLPAFIVLLDWVHRGQRELPLPQRAWQLLQRNWPVYLALILTSMAYLLLRGWALDSATPAAMAAVRVPDLAQLDRITWTYLKYWNVISGVGSNLNPLHTAISFRFGAEPWRVAMHLAAALGVAALGLLVFTRRFAATGAATIAASISLLPFIGIIPISFDHSLYHERYAMVGIALLCVFLPYVIHEWRPLARRVPMLAQLLPLLPVVWLALAIPSIRVTIPLWSSNVTLWEWAVRDNYQHPKAWGNLINAYMRTRQYEKASATVERMLAVNLKDCELCYVNGFIAAVNAGDTPLAERMIQIIHRRQVLSTSEPSRYYFARALGHLKLRLGEPAAAVKALHEAMQYRDTDSLGHMMLAEALMATGQPEAAGKQARRAVAVTYPARRSEMQTAARNILAGQSVFGKPMQTTRAAPATSATLPATATTTLPSGKPATTGH